MEAKITPDSESSGVQDTTSPVTIRESGGMFNDSPPRPIPTILPVISSPDNPPSTNAGRSRSRKNSKGSKSRNRVRKSSHPSGDLLSHQFITLETKLKEMKEKKNRLAASGQSTIDNQPPAVSASRERIMGRRSIDKKGEGIGEGQEFNSLEKLMVTIKSAHALSPQQQPKLQPKSTHSQLLSPNTQSSKANIAAKQAADILKTKLDDRLQLKDNSNPGKSAKNNSNAGSGGKGKEAVAALVGKGAISSAGKDAIPIVGGKGVYRHKDKQACTLEVLTPTGRDVAKSCNTTPVANRKRENLKTVEGIAKLGKAVSGVVEGNSQRAGKVIKRMSEHLTRTGESTPSGSLADLPKRPLFKLPSEHGITQILSTPRHGHPPPPAPPRESVTADLDSFMKGLPKRMDTRQLERAVNPLTDQLESVLEGEASLLLQGDKILSRQGSGDILSLL